MERHKLWIIEFFIWLLIIVAVVLSIRLYRANLFSKDSTYHIFLQDIDGLMKGSPVKLMGVQVGYVTEINVVEDYMYVSFLISKEGVKVPQGAKALIESYGIAGSKSIELYPPNEKVDNSTPLIFVEKPIRASTTFLTQNEIAKTLITMTNGTTSMLDSKSVEQHRKNIQKLAILSGTDELDKIDEFSDEMLIKVKSFNKNKEKSEKEDKKDE